MSPSLPAPDKLLKQHILEARDGGDRIDTTAHRCSPIHQPAMSDDSRAFIEDEAMRRDLEAEDELMRWTRTDSIRAVVLVGLTLVACHYFPGVWFAGWLK